MPILINPATGELGLSDDPTGALQQGWRLATDEEADAAARRLDFGTFEQQSQAQIERVVRGATLGAVDGIGLPDDIRARAEVSEELSPVTSALASIAPDVGVAALTGGLGGLATAGGRLAARTALAEGAGLLRAGLAAGRAGGLAALAGESIGSGLVGSGQAAYAEGRELGDDPGRDAENALIWGGLNFGLGAAMGARHGAAEALPVEEIDDIAKAAEARGMAKAEADVGQGFNELDAARIAGAGALIAGSAALGEEGQTEGAAAAGLGGLAVLFPKFSLTKSHAFQAFVDDLAHIEKATPEVLASAKQATSVLVKEGAMPAHEAAELVGTIQRAVDDPGLVEKEAARIAKDAVDEPAAIIADAPLQLSSEPPKGFAEGSSKKQRAESEILLGRASRLPEENGPAREKAIEKLWKSVYDLPEVPEYRAADPAVIEELTERVQSAVDSLPEEQLRSIRKFTGGFFDEIRSAEKRAATGREMHAWLQKFVADVPNVNEAIDRMLVLNPTKHGELYRGMSVQADAIDELMHVDQLYVHGPTSTSYDPKIAKSFAKSTIPADHEVMLHFRNVDYGAPVLHTTAAPMREAEVIIPRGGKYQVTGRFQSFSEGKQTLHVMLDQVANSSKDDVMRMGALALLAGVGGYATDDTEGAALASGGLLGLLLGRRGLGLGKAAIRRGEREAVEGGVERALRKASKADADDIVKRALGKAPEREADSFGRQRRLYINRAAVLDVAEREMSQDVTRLMKDVEQVARTDKQASISKHVSDALKPQKAVAKTISGDAAKFAGELRAEARAYAKASGKNGIQYPISGAKDLNLALLDHASAVAKAKTSRGMFEALDTFKRTLQDMKLTLEQGAANADNAIHHQRLIPRIDTFERKIRAALEDSATWGKAGEMQRAYNAVLADKLLPSMRIFEESVLQRTHRTYDGVWNLEGWETKARALLENADPGNRRHVAAVLDGMDELASVRRQYGDAKLANRIEAQTAKVRRTLGLADEVHDATERMQALGTLAGAVPLVGGTTRAAVVGDLTAAWQRLSGATEAAAQRGVDDWIRSSRVRGAGMRARLPKVPELSGEAKQLRDIAVRRGVSTGMLLFLGDDASPGAAFERWRDALIDEQKFFDELGHDYGTLAAEAPDVFMALSARADLARRFLLQRMPPNVAVSMANPEGYPPSNAAVEDWAQYVNAVRFPTRVVQELAAISVQEAEALRTVHPRLYELTQQRIIEGIARAQQAGEPLDDTFLARVGILFPELDGVGSPVFSREFGEAVRAHNQLRREMRAATSGARGGSGRPQQPNPLQATIQSGATFGQGS